ncbi:MAG: riboflavin synthase [Planctomycetes bacterium]|nr:riboflavin synthase [Planctomycetota bacterium]
MFTGIVEAALPVRSVEDVDGVRRVHVDLSSLKGSSSLKLGDSVAINGCCLTIANIDGARAIFEAIPETLGLTNLGDLVSGSTINIERALMAGARFDGHFVQGHVDQVAEVGDIRENEGEWRVRIDCGRTFADQCIAKGSVCVDGISLTIAELDDDCFVTAIIPHTRQVTNIREWKVGTRVNLEADLIGKYVRRQLQRDTTSSVDEDLLRRAGFIAG